MAHHQCGGHDQHGHHHHQHQHQHQHHHFSQDPDKTLGERNKEHFDHVAATVFDTPWIAKLGEQVSHELRSNFEWFGVKANSDTAQTKMLDYACGNGIISRALSSHVAVVRGVDISSGMVTQYNILAGKAGLSPEKMHAVHGDLLDSEATPSAALATAEFRNFDLAVMSLALHHVSDVDAMIKSLADRLADGGVLVIVDWMSEAEGSGWLTDASDSPVRHTVSEKGFSEDALRRTFEKAGLKGWGWKTFAERSEVPSEIGGSFQGFLARGVKGV